MSVPTIKVNDNAEWETSALHMVSWTHPDEGWQALESVVDEFLVAALKGIANEAQVGDANWLFLNFEFGRLMVYPSAEDAFECTRSEHIFFQLFSVLLEKMTGNHLEWEERGGSDGKVGHYPKRPDDVLACVDDTTQKEISHRKWEIIRDCLTQGNASAELQIARQKHVMKIAAFEFDPCEGNHYLLELADPDFFDAWSKCKDHKRRDA
jgi:hypothetical protein